MSCAVETAAIVATARLAVAALGGKSAAVRAMSSTAVGFGLPTDLGAVVRLKGGQDHQASTTANSVPLTWIIGLPRPKSATGAPAA